MQLNAKQIIADFISISLQIFLIPVYILVFIVRVLLRYIDDSKEIIAKNIIITGATSGLGKAITKKYAKTAANLYLVGRNDEKLENIKKECKAINSKVNVKLIKADIADCDKFRNIINTVAKNEKVQFLVQYNIEG